MIMGIICRGTAIAGRSRDMKRIYGVIEKIAPMNVNVLISGESGCGKGTLARVIHELSGRPGPFGVFDPVSVSSDSVGDGELEAALEDAFLSCGGGTLLIDDAADADARLQSRLISVLSFKNESRDSLYGRVRVIASTNRNIAELARQARFRQDLCDILSVVSVELPPLRHRREDISELADIFLKEYAGCGREIRSLSKEALGILVKYDWPGNVRELENVLKQAAISSECAEIGPTSLPAKVRRKNATVAPKATVRDELYKLAKGLIESGAHLEKAEPYGEYLKIVETPLLQAAMDMCGGNKSLAAKRIRINRNTLSKKLREYGIE